MIDLVNGLLVRLLTTRIPGLLPSQIGVNPPDQDWRNLVSGMTSYALNIYLVELSENVELRTNERRFGAGTHRADPARLDCRYLISAWSPATANALTDPAADEAVALYRVTQVLMNESPLEPAKIYAPGPLPPGFPPDLAEPALPTVVAPADPFVKLADFWMRMDSVWRPVVDFTVTVPVLFDVQPTAPAVTTLVSRYRDGELIAIGGVVRLTPSNVPVPGAWVRLVELDHTVRANVAGQFVFAGVLPGQYTVEAGAPGHTTVTRLIDVPTLSGEYDIHLS